MIGEASPSFEVMNELLICTMDTSAKLDIEITIGKGRGYVPAENKEKNSLRIYFPSTPSYPDQECKILIENTRGTAPISKTDRKWLPMVPFTRKTR